jgi:hypothetical protein
MKLIFAITILFLSSCGQSSGYAPTISADGSITYANCQAAGSCLVFVSASTYTGNLGGATGADAKCMSDANKPSGTNTYKAMIGSTGQRTILLDWVLAPHVDYYRTDSTTLIGRTDSNAVFTFSLSNSITSATNEVWVGFHNAAFDILTDCTNWTSTTANGMVGNSQVIDATAVGVVSGACSVARHLYCVEQ